jgi:hypothetical protein
MQFNLRMLSVISQGQLNQSLNRTDSTLKGETLGNKVDDKFNF